MNRIIINYLFNASYQLLLVFLPFITTPYIARVLGPEKLGTNAYTFSIIQILVIIGMLGIPLYGNKQIAIYADDSKERLSKEFWSIYTVQFVAIIVCLVPYVIYSFSLSSEFWIKISLLQGLHLVAALFDISWLLLGLQHLKQAVTRNLIFKVLSIILIFIFVNDENDLDIYIYIMGGTMVIGQALLWYYAKKLVNIRPSFDLSRIKTHIKPIAILFLPQVLGQLYLSLDKIILKVFTTNLQVGYYDQALKIIKLILTIVTSISAVMLPNISSEFTKGNRDKVIYYVEKIFRFILFITIPMVVGISSISDIFINWFLGPDFLPVADLLKILSPIIFFIGLGSLFGIQILAATNQVNKLTVSIFCGALVSVIFSLVYVSKYGAYATAVSTLLAEMTVASIQLYFVRKYIKLKKFFKSTFYYIISSMIMMFFIYILSFVEVSYILVTIIQVFVGFLVYIVILLIVKEQFICEVKSMLLSAIKGKIKKI